MKVFYLLFVFILNFKLILCQNGFPPGRFLIRNLRNQLLTVGPDRKTVLFSSPNPSPNPSPYSVWTVNGPFLTNLAVGLHLSVNGEIKSGSLLVVSPPGNLAGQNWRWNGPLDYRNKGTIGLSRVPELVISSNPSNNAIIDTLSPSNPNEVLQLEPA